MHHFGVKARQHFHLADNIIPLNHGSFGTTPKAVLSKQFDILQRSEQFPDQFYRHDSYIEQREVLQQLGQFVKAKPDNLVFIPNATVGCQTVVESQNLQVNDKVLCFSHIYPAVRKGLLNTLEQTGSELIEIPIPLVDDVHNELLKQLKKTLLQEPNIRFAIIEHIGSPSALTMPLEEMVALCKQHQITVLVDGAHGIGQLDLDLESLGADYYVTNCHKWLLSPKGTALLWVKPELQDTCLPLLVSHHHADDFHKRFWMQATRDESCYIATGFALNWMQELGINNIRHYNNTLANEAQAMLTEQWQTTGVHLNFPHHHMALVETPLKDPEILASPGASEKSVKLFLTLMKQNICVSTLSWQGKIFFRISAQIYNTIDDYKHLINVSI